MKNSDKQKRQRFPCACPNCKNGIKIKGEKQHICHIPGCNKVFKRTYSLKYHLKNHSGDKPFICKFCGKGYITGYKHRIHEETHTGERPYECVECDKKFMTASNLQRHRHTHAVERPHKCMECNKKFKSSSDLRRHERTHTEKSQYECMQCNKKFKTKFILKRHKRTHTGKKVYECIKCDRQFRTSYNFLSHKETHTGKKRNRKNKFTRLDSLTRHMKRCHEETIQDNDNVDMQMQNDDCEESLEVVKTEIEDTVVSSEFETIKNELIENISFDDKNQVPNISSLSTMRTLRSFKNVPIVQSVCINTNVESTSTLPASLTVKNSKRRKKQKTTCTCPNCEKGIKFKNGEKRHKCHIPTCNKSFRKTNHLQYHLKWHNGEKPFICNPCGKGFRDKGHLAIHMKRHQKPIISDSNGDPMHINAKSQSNEGEEILGEEHFDIDDASSNEDEPGKVRGSLNNKKDDWETCSLTPSAASGDECNYDEEMMITIKEEDEFIAISTDPLDMNFLD